MAFWTGRYASKRAFLWVVEPEDVLELVRHNFAGRVRFVDGAAEIVPGVTVHHVGGHAAGLQVVALQTARGRVVLASDAAHYYANIEEDRPFAVVSDLPQMYDAFETVRALADSPDHVIPGHDPLVLDALPRRAGSGGHRGPAGLVQRRESALWAARSGPSRDRKTCTVSRPEFAGHAAVGGVGDEAHRVHPKGIGDAAFGILDLERNESPRSDEGIHDHVTCSFWIPWL